MSLSQPPRSLTLRVLCLMSLCATLALAGCDVRAGATYQPPFIPVEFVLDTQGQISVQVGSASITTPIGDFSVGAAAEQNLTAPVGSLLVKLERLVNGQPTDGVFQLHEDSAEKLLIIDDDIMITFTGKVLSIDAKRHHTVIVTTPQAQHNLITYCTLPTLDPHARDFIGDVRFTTTLTDWQTGTLEPQDNVNSTALKEPIIAALLIQTNSPGTVTVKQKYCSDGHDNPFCDDSSESVPANLAGTWYHSGDFVYSTACSQDVGPVMFMWYWNGIPVHANFLTTETTDTAFACPAPSITHASSFSLANLTIGASRITQRDTASISFSYTASTSGTLETYICVDGTTQRNGVALVAAGSSSISDSRVMAAGIGDQCTGCEEFGHALWIIVWNKQVVGAVPFTVTE